MLLSLSIFWGQLLFSRNGGLHDTERYKWKTLQVHYNIHDISILHGDIGFINNNDCLMSRKIKWSAETVVVGNNKNFSGQVFFLWWILHRIMPHISPYWYRSRYISFSQWEVWLCFGSMPHTLSLVWAAALFSTFVFASLLLHSDCKVIYSLMEWWCKLANGRPTCKNVHVQHNVMCLRTWAG